MRDQQGRNIDYARISVTDRCNLRCVYCMPESGIVKQRHADILSFEDIVRVCQALSAVNVSKIKITGGEALVRRGIVALVGRIKSLPGIDAVTLTTNGQLLAGMARSLRDAGLDGINISLDALDPVLYRELTRGGEVADVVRGIDAAAECGFPAVKINCVPIAGLNERELPAIAGLARERRLHTRFIEMMPIGMGASFSPVGRERLRRLLENAYGAMRPIPAPPGNGPAVYCSLPGFCGSIGFIHTLDHGICGRCNRLRLTCDGFLKTCLHMDAGVSLKPALAANDPAMLERVIARAVMHKPPHHEFAAGGRKNEQRPMSQIGG